MTKSTPRSGRQVTIEAGDYRAEIATVGATLRSLHHRERALTATFDADEVRPSSLGTSLLPWPNRISEGRYRFGGAQRQLAITEPTRDNAIHGLASWLDWQVLGSSADTVELRTSIAAQPGYPHPLEARARFRVDADGLHWSLAARNLGDTPAPYGVAIHPYLALPAGRTDDWTLRAAAAGVLDVTEDTKRPLGRHPVGDFHGGACDFRTARTIGAAVIDHALTGIVPDPDGLARAELTAGPDQPGVVLSWDPERLPWVQLFTADLPGHPDLDRRALAVEPMTCPPDAFNSGEGLIVLGPGEEHEAEWHFAALEPGA